MHSYVLSYFTNKPKHSIARKWGKSERFDTATGLVFFSHWIQIVDFSLRVTFKFNGWSSKTIRQLFYALSNFVHYFTAISEFKLELQSWYKQFRSQSATFVPSDLEIRQMTLKNNRELLLCHLKLCTSFHSHLWIQTWITVRKHPISVKFVNLCPFGIEIWRMTLKNNRAPPLRHW